MTERFKAAVLKPLAPKGARHSNPSPPAIYQLAHPNRIPDRFTRSALSTPFYTSRLMAALTGIRASIRCER